MMPWREFRELSYISVVLVMLVAAFVGFQWYRASSAPRSAQEKIPAIAGSQHPVGFPPVHVSPPPTSIFAVDTYTAGRPTDTPVQPMRIIQPRYSVVPVAPNVYKSIYFSPPQNP